MPIEIKKAGDPIPRILIYGEPGIGKTTAGTDMPKPIFLASENSFNARKFKNIDYIEPQKWEDVNEFLRLFLTTDTFSQYQSIVIDTIDWLEPMLVDYICRINKKTSINDFGYGAGYVALAEHFRKFLMDLDLLQQRKKIWLLFLAHSQIRTFTNPLGENYDRYEMKLSTKLTGLLKEWVSTILFANFKVLVAKNRSTDTEGKAKSDEMHYIFSTGGTGWDAKSRDDIPYEMIFDMVSILQYITGEKIIDISEYEKEFNELKHHIPKDKLSTTEKWIAESKTIGDKVRKYKQAIEKIKKEL